MYVLYKKDEENYNVKYIGVGGISEDAKSGIFASLKNHEKNKEDWTHYSLFEVHDNISNDEIRELESLFLTIFKNDRNIEITNTQKSSYILKKLSKDKMW